MGRTNPTRETNTMSEATPDTGAPIPDPANEPEPVTGGPADLAAEIEKWKAQARKHEDRAKANAAAAKELEQVRAAAMTDQERAVAEARAQARTETLKEVGAERVADAVRVAAAGRLVDVDALLEGLDRTRFLDADGQPDVAAITTWVDRVAPKPSEGPAGFPDLGQGARTPSHALNGDPLTRDLKNVLGIR
jgi:hypothetical protein